MYREMGVRRMPMIWSLCPSSTTIGPSSEPWGTPLLHEVFFLRNNSLTFQFNNFDICKTKFVTSVKTTPTSTKSDLLLSDRNSASLLTNSPREQSLTFCPAQSPGYQTTVISPRTQTQRWPYVVSSIPLQRSIAAILPQALFKPESRVADIWRGQLRVHHFIWWWEIKHRGT